MTTVINTLLNIVANVSGQQAVEAMRSGVGALATGFDRVQIANNSLMSGLRKLSILVSGGMFGMMVKGAAEYGESLDLASQKTGLGVVELAKWGAAAKLQNQSIETVETGFKRLSKTMLEVMTGDDKARAAFTALGLNFDELKNKNPNEVMLKIADSISTMPDGFVKAGVMVKLFGKNATDMIPILNMGREAIEAIPTAVTERFTDMSTVFEENIKKMGGASNNFKINVTSGLLPSLIDMQNVFIDVFNSKSDWSKFFEVVGSGIRILGLSFIGLSNTLGSFKDLMVMDFSVVSDTIRNKNAGMSLGDAFETARENALGKYKQATQARMVDIQKEIDDLKAHDKYVGDPNAPIKPNVVQKDSSKTVSAINALLAAGDKPKEDAEANKYDIRIGKLRAESQERKTALMEEISNVNLTAAAIENLKDSRETEKKIQEAVIGLSPAHAAAYRAEATAAEQAREALRLKNEEEKKSMSYGIADWAQKYQEEVTNTAKQTAAIMQKSFDGMATGLTNFVMGAKTGFSELVQSIIADMIKMSIESGITGPLAKALFGGAAAGAGGSTASGGIGEFIRSIFGFADGGVMTSAGPMQLRRYAKGGVANSPQVSIWGEGDTPEANVPLPDGRSIPVTLSGAGKGGDTNIEFHYHESTGTTASRGGGMGQTNAAALSGLITNAVKGIILNEKRPGGLLSASAAGG
jgi:hypothetical protein